MKLKTKLNFIHMKLNLKSNLINIFIIFIIFQQNNKYIDYVKKKQSAQMKLSMFLKKY